ncbi:MAG: 30S ribosomal protein S18 [Phycisphaerales bacterium]|nr:30S ribosomal protein S18 [Phycisphaerales bacterium]
MLKQARAKRRKARRAAETPRFRGAKLNAEQFDYKDVATLQRLTTAQGKLFSRKRTGLDAEAQRRVALELKRARFMALMPYVT